VEGGAIGDAESSRGVRGMLGEETDEPHEEDGVDDIRRGVVSLSVYEGVGECWTLEAEPDDEARLSRDGGVGVGREGTLKCIG
jgi:hypothetical protein